jgi:hypothetical protein
LRSAFSEILIPEATHVLGVTEGRRLGSVALTTKPGSGYEVPQARDGEDRKGLAGVVQDALGAETHDARTFRELRDGESTAISSIAKTRSTRLSLFHRSLSTLFEECRYRDVPSSSQNFRTDICSSE